jgi:hypothetical protein
VPIHYQRDDAKQRIMVRSEGMPTLEEVLGIMDRQAAERAWSYAVLYDSRGASRAPTPEELTEILRHIGELTAKHGPRGPVAMIIGNPEFFKAARRYASLGELTALQAELFATPEAAELWLQTVKHA